MEVGTSVIFLFNTNVRLSMISLQVFNLFWLLSLVPFYNSRFFRIPGNWLSTILIRIPSYSFSSQYTGSVHLLVTYGLYIGSVVVGDLKNIVSVVCCHKCF